MIPAIGAVVKSRRGKRGHARDGKGGRSVPRWWWKVRYGVKSIMLPLICIQFVRTLILPNPLDVFLLFLFFLAYLGFLFNFY